MHNNHIIDGINKDIDLIHTREAYVGLTKNFKSRLPEIVIKKHDNINVIREDKMLIGGTKTRIGEFLFSQITNRVVVYVVPRFGLAGAAIMELCKLYDKEAIFFMPACKEISDHQAYVINQKPKEVHFKRIAAMPNLNIIAKKYADLHGYEFIPFGLNHSWVIAGAVRVCENLLNNYKEPDQLWTAVSTGVLTRGLQIGFENTEMHGVAVARNMKAGELGRTSIISEPLAFHSKEKQLPPFDTVDNYDAKVWKYIPKDTNKNIWFWNVAKDLKCPINFDKSLVNSYRSWND
jgi:hypothetical protein